MKIFASSRPSEEVERFDTIIRGVLNGGVNHPRVLESRSGLIYSDSKTRLDMAVMELVHGETFYDMKRSPSDDELDKIMQQAALIHDLSLNPPYVDDDWALPNIGARYKRVQAYLDDNEREQVEGIVAAYKAVQHRRLPHCFVHGDITKSNVIKSSDGEMHIIDYSVANWYPRIQELAVIIGNLMNDEQSGDSLLQVMQKVVTKYVEQGGELTTVEMEALPAYARAAYAMEFIGASIEKFLRRNETDENDYWRNLGWTGIMRSLS